MTPNKFDGSCPNMLLLQREYLLPLPFTLIWAYNYFDQYNPAQGMPCSLTWQLLLLLLSSWNTLSEHCISEASHHLWEPQIPWRSHCGCSSVSGPTRPLFTLLRGLIYLSTPALANSTHPSNLKQKVFPQRCLHLKYASSTQVPIL